MSETREVAKKSHWTVRLTTPKRALPEKEYEYQANVVCHVVADNIDDAIAATRELYPRGSVWAVNHHGKIDIITGALVNP